MLDVAHNHLDGYRYKLVGPNLDKMETNCCIATEQIMMEYFDIEFSSEQHGDLMILDPKRPWSPIDAVVSAGIGQAVDAPVPGRFHLMQTWRGLNPLDRGHSVIYFESPMMMLDGCLVIQATYDMTRAFLPVEDFAEANRGYHYRLAVLNER